MQPLRLALTGCALHVAPATTPGGARVRARVLAALAKLTPPRPRPALLESWGSAEIWRSKGGAS